MITRLDCGRVEVVKRTWIRRPHHGAPNTQCWNLVLEIIFTLLKILASGRIKHVTPDIKIQYGITL